MTSTQRIGNDESNFWIYDPDTGLTDLSRDAPPKQPLLTVQTTTSPIRLNPATTALLIIDMQNFFLSPAVRPRINSQQPSPAEAAAQALLHTGIPAARAHGIRTIWLNWGLTEQDLATMPPSTMRLFGSYGAIPPEAQSQTPSPSEAKKLTPSAPNMIRVKNPALYRGLGTDLGAVMVGRGESVQAGRALMRESWNAALYGPLEKVYCAGVGGDAKARPDVLVYKNRVSGLCLPGSELERFLEREGVTTLLFAGVNTDQCVGGTLMDACNKGYDCILLRDGSATATPFGASEAWEWNIMNCWGWVTTCEALKDGIMS
ncbi:uncharacterized protein N7459_004737 [Penicillium hispanicum]|uniref:uncharacterized protein n=1 Tax=Penicillium hispanicum TaxID=1080232 RepID=UPI0025424EB1|nr:uncharacterized protein N7459_004737 [Penicillium hispanicum]KAJ5584937.1 hypothetical protein N7459_004737 [Penicillium hispanicum]